MSKWPKTPPALTAEQERIKDDWMKYWLGILPKRHGAVLRFSHAYPGGRAREGQCVLDIGAGLGEHLEWEVAPAAEYHAIELRPEIAEELRRRHPRVRVVVGDCQRSIPYPDASFDRVVAIHVLEHLPDLPAALKEIRRTLRPGGELDVVIPCEGGLAYRIGRYFTSRRLFEQRYDMSYDLCIQSDHVNRADEILDELGSRFEVRDAAYFPFRIPSVTLNVAIGLVLEPRGEAGDDDGCRMTAGG